MYKVFYRLAGNYYNATDIKHCLDLASAMFLQDSSLVFTIYLISNSQLSALMGVQGLTYDNTSFSYGNITGRIETERTYAPKQGREVVLAICMLDEKTLCKIENSPSIYSMFVVPEMPGYIDHWLQLHSAYDISSSSPQPIAGIPTCTVELKRTIGYLKDYTRKLNVDLTHTSIQQGMLQSVFNAFKSNAADVHYDEVYAESLRRGLSHQEAEILAKAFSRKTSYPNTTITNWIYINDPQWENN